MGPVKTVAGRGLPLIIDDIDTDRIVPARFLRCVTFDGIGKFAFYDERYYSDGTPKNFPMNEPVYEGASVILAGKNFGCGSSREHAPQSLRRAGFNAVIAESFAEIFFGNSLTIGLVCATMPGSAIAEISNGLKENTESEIILSVDACTVEFRGKKYPFRIPETARNALINGSYDLLAELLRNNKKVTEAAKMLPY